MSFFKKNFLLIFFSLFFFALSARISSAQLNPETGPGWWCSKALCVSPTSVTIPWTTVYMAGSSCQLNVSLGTSPSNISHYTYLSSDSTSYTFSGLSPDTTYYWTVKGKDPSESGEISCDIQAGSGEFVHLGFSGTFTTGYCNAPPPPVPSYNSSCDTSGNINLSWGASAGATYYLLKINDLANGFDDSCASPLAGDYCATTSATSFSWPGGVAGDRYNTSIFACDDPSVTGSHCSGPTGEPYGVPFTCPAPNCGNGVADSGENCSNCPQDMPPGACSLPSCQCGSANEKSYTIKPTTDLCLPPAINNPLTETYPGSKVWKWDCANGASCQSKSCITKKSGSIREVQP